MNTKYRIDRRKALGLMGGAVSLVAVPGKRAFAQSLRQMRGERAFDAQQQFGA